MTKNIRGLFIEDLERRQAPATFPAVPLPDAALAHANSNAPFSEPVYTTMAVGEEDGGAFERLVPVQTHGWSADLPNSWTTVGHKHVDPLTVQADPGAGRAYYTRDGEFHVDAASRVNQPAFGVGLNRAADIPTAHAGGTVTEEVSIKPIRLELA